MTTMWKAGLAIGALGLLSLFSCTSQISDFFRGYAEGEAQALEHYDPAALTRERRGALYFTLGDFGGLNTDTLETHAVPWRLTAAALVLRDVDANGGAVAPSRIRPIMTRFGFLYAETIGNWPDGLAPPTRALEAPQGMSLGVVRRAIPRVELTAANLSCASCHSGPTYDASGAPQLQIAWLGAPNTSLNLELYVREVYAAMKFARRDEAQLMAAVTTLFPDTSDAELQALRRYVMPRLQARMDALEAEDDRPLPFMNGAPGLTNGVAALRMQLGTLGDNPYEELRGFTSIPDLGARGFRSALLYDAAYSPRGDEINRAIRGEDIDEAHLHRLAEVTSFFTVPSMGVPPGRAGDHIAEANDIFAYLRNYEAPRFPGRIDEQLAARGAPIYAQRCASCHGAYDADITHPRLLSFPNWIGAYDTDPARAAAFDAATVNAVNASPYGRRILARATGQYAAPPLTGLWLSAPYLHNGSVPTLWHLMNPSERPVRFQTGGHRLDFARVGVAGVQARNGDYLYPPGYQPWSQSTIINTREPGLGNQGHLMPFDHMREAEKRALLEYLKAL